MRSGSAVHVPSTRHHPIRTRAFHTLIGPVPFAVALFWLSGCAIEQEISRTPRTAVEQLLLTGAVDRALTNLTLTLPAQASLHLEVSGFYIDRARLICGTEPPARCRIPRWIFCLFGIRSRWRSAEWAIAFGNARTTRLPCSRGHRGARHHARPDLCRHAAHPKCCRSVCLPELTMYKHQAQSGYARFHLDVFDDLTGDYKGSSATTHRSHALRSIHGLVLHHLARHRPHGAPLSDAVQNHVPPHTPRHS